jgi:hypothetical protein
MAVGATAGKLGSMESNVGAGPVCVGAGVVVALVDCCGSGFESLCCSASTLRAPHAGEDSTAINHKVRHCHARCPCHPRMVALWRSDEHGASRGSGVRTPGMFHRVLSLEVRRGAERSAAPLRADNSWAGSAHLPAMGEFHCLNLARADGSPRRVLSIGEQGGWGWLLTCGVADPCRRAGTAFVRWSWAPTLRAGAGGG